MADKVKIANDVLAANPQLSKNPDLANQVLNSPDPQGAATSLSHAYNVSTIQQNLQDHAAEADNMSIWKKALGGAERLAMGSLSWLAKPLQEIQKDYKFIHSVYTRHGIFEGLMATLGVVGGAAGGAILGGPIGAAAGADLVAATERNIGGRLIGSYRDSFNDSENPNYKVSAGRDFANAISNVPGMGALNNTDHGLGKIVSGTTDALFDFTFDPVVVGFKARAAVKSGEFLLAKEGKFFNKLPLRNLSTGVNDFLERNSLQTFSSPEQLDKLYQAGLKPTVMDNVFGGGGKQYVRALNEIADIANKQGAGGIVAKFPGLQGLSEHLATGEGAEVTAKDVHDVFMQAQWDQEFMQNWTVNGASMVPGRTVLRAALSKASDKLRQWDANDEIYFRANQANFFLPRRTAKVSLVDVVDPETGQVSQVLQTAADKSLVLPVAMRPWSGDAWKSAIAGKVRTFSGYLPYTIDSKTLELSNTRFDPEDPASALIVYRIGRFSLPESMARQKATEFVQGDLATKKSIYSGLIGEMFKAAGAPNDLEYVQEMNQKVATALHGTIGETNFGPGHFSGDDNSIVEFNGQSSAQGMFMDHRGQFAIPDFREVKTAMRQAGTYGKLYGNIDNFAARYTDGFFKPLALLTGGFGLRIAASEIIPTVFRFGGYEYAKSKVSGAAAKMNYKLAKGEDEALVENAIQAVSEGADPVEYINNAKDAVSGKIVRKAVSKGLSKLASEEDLDLATRIAIATRGHMAVGATLTGHGIPAEQQEFARQVVELAGIRNKRKFALPTGKWGTFAQSDEKFDLHYYTELSKSAVVTSRRQIIADALNELKNGADIDEAWEIARLKDEARIRGVKFDENAPDFMGDKLPKGQDIYADERKVMAGYVNETPEGFSSRRIDAMRNIFSGHRDLGGKPNIDFMEKIAAGKKPLLSEVKEVPVELKPASVGGQEYEMTVGPNLLNRIINFGFGKVVDPIVNNLSRQPLYFNHVKQQLGFLKNAVDNNFINEEEALRISMTRGAYAMVPQIHNTALRTQFSVLARNYLPFYFAQEQAMRRAGSLILSNPAAFRQYQLVTQGVNDPAFVEKDASGQKRVTIPIVGELGASFLNAASALGLPVVGGLPVNASGSIESLKTVLPETTMPGTSPFVSVLANALGALDPSLDREIKKVVGGAGFSKSLFDQLMPNSVARTVFHAIDAKETESTFLNAEIAALAAASLHNQIPDANASPLEKQAFLDRIKNNAKSIMIMKAILGTMSPLAPQVTQEDLGLRKEFYDLLKQKSPVTGKPLTYPEALQEFVKNHGTGAISYTIARTEGAVKGATTPYTDQAINWIEGNKGLLYGKNAVGAAFLIPQNPSGAGDAQAIHDEVIKMNLRSTRTPEDFLKAYYVAAGNNYIADQRKTHDKAMEDLKARGLSQQAERAAWNDYVQAYGQMNPLWYDDYTSPDRKHIAQMAFADLSEILKDPNSVHSKTEQGKLIRGLINDWITHNQAMTIYRSSRNANGTSAESDNWNKYLDKMVNDHPILNTVVNTVFARLG